jgi:serine/threonine protein kinase
MRPERACLGECIGEGSFGVVFDGTYKLYKDRAPVPVAYKRMKISVRGLAQEIMDALTNEVVLIFYSVPTKIKLRKFRISPQVQAMQRLNHPNLLRLYCVCDDPEAVDMKGNSIGVSLCLELCDKGCVNQRMFGVNSS